MPDHDVLIVGAGPVGILLACLLVQEGFDVAVCDRREGADGRTKAIGIHRPGLDALDAAGVGAAVRAEALQLDGGDVLSRGRVLASLTFTADRPVLVLPQPRTDELLRARLDELSPASLRLGHRVVGIRQDGELVRVAAEAATGRIALTASFAVIADGVHSPLRTALGVGWTQRPGSARYAMLDVPDPDGGRRARLHCEPAGLVESFPLPGGARRWVLRAAPTADGAAPTAAEFRAAVADRTGSRPAIPADAQPTVFRAAQHLAHPMRRGRVVLLGDAAHELSPIGGQGMNLGWLDAVRLADTITGALSQGARPDLGGFERRVRRSARAAQRRSAFYMAMGGTAAGVPLRAREALIRTLGSRPLRAWTAGLITMRGL